MKEEENVHPTYKDLLAFLNQRIHVLEKSVSNNQNYDISNSSEKSSTIRVNEVNFKNKEVKYPCPNCNNKSHSLDRCSKFKKSNVLERHKLVASWNLCFNYFKPRHSAKECKSHNRCPKCKAAHHILYI